MEILKIKETILNIIKILDDNADKFDEIYEKIKKLEEEVLDLDFQVRLLKKKKNN